MNLYRALHCTSSTKHTRTTPTETGARRKENNRATISPILTSVLPMLLFATAIFGNKKNNQANNSNKKNNKQQNNNNNNNNNNNKQQKNPVRLPKNSRRSPRSASSSSRSGSSPRSGSTRTPTGSTTKKSTSGRNPGPVRLPLGYDPILPSQRLLVVANLKAKNLVKFKSHGMVLCAASQTEDGTEIVEFVEPPEGAKPGDVVSFEGLPKPMPLAPSQVEKKKVFGNCLEGLKTDDDRIATWKGHKFVVVGEGSDNYCRTKTICNGPLR